jgi:uncharacterized 2Fe-2S/4Fe-4S cluster protein (DUF4445 family)
MPLVTFLPAGENIEAEAGTELMDAAKALGLAVDAPCGGKGTCGRCMVRIVSGNVEADSLGALDKDEVAAGFVLACRTRVGRAPVTVELPEISSKTGGKFIENAEESLLVKKELMPAEWNYGPMTVKWLLDVPPPLPGDGLSDLDRLSASIQGQWGRKEVCFPLSVIRQVASAIRADGGRATVTLIDEGARLNVVGIEAGDATTRHYGIAVDVGTTTIAVELVQLHEAKIVEVATDYNDQIECGLDVISRINYASRPQRLKELREKALATVNRLVRRVCEDSGLKPREISTAVVSGNTVMTHLLLGLDPEYIRLEPYVPTLYRASGIPASDIGIDINRESWVRISPSVGSYVGGDITSGVLCTDLAADKEEVSLFIDIGTNGEIVVGNKDFLMTCACSAGPAFEGGGIDCGMRASLGAIERVSVDPRTGEPSWTAIGGGKPRGICGSGMISLIAELFLSGWLDGSGKLERGRPCDRVIADGRRASYLIARAEESATGKPIAASELDIQNILRAKAAIYSACDIMLSQLGMEASELASVYVAGGFGRFLDLEKAIAIGMIPDLPLEKYHYIGNASLMGSYMILVSQDFMRRQDEIASRMTYIDLGSMSGYMDRYSAALFLPHTDARLFPSVHSKAAR